MPTSSDSPQMPLTSSLPEQPYALTLALVNAFFSLLVVVFGSIAVTWRPKMPPDYHEAWWFHVPTYTFQPFEIAFSAIVLIYEISCARKPRVALTLTGVVCASVTALMMIIQVLHKTSPRQSGASLFNDYRDVDKPYPWPARTISHQGLDYWWEWLTLIIVFTLQSWYASSFQ